MAKKQKAKKLKVTKLKLRPFQVVRVAIPKGVLPVVAASERVIEIAPIKVKAKRSWWSTLFGN